MILSKLIATFGYETNLEMYSFCQRVKHDRIYFGDVHSENCLFLYSTYSYKVTKNPIFIY